MWTLESALSSGPSDEEQYRPRLPITARNSYRRTPWGRRRWILRVAFGRAKLRGQWVQSGLQQGVRTSPTSDADEQPSVVEQFLRDHESHESQVRRMPNPPIVMGPSGSRSRR